MTPAVEAINPPSDSPQQAFAELLQFSSGALLHTTIALALGAITASQMRRRNLHWSWAAVAFACVALARHALAGSAWTLALATAFAATRGRRWQRHDIDSGADLAEIAAARHTPLHTARMLARELAARIGERVPLRIDGGGGLTIGHDRHGSAVTVPCGGGTDGSGGLHTLVVGATGSGKTVTQTLMTVRSIERGMGAIVIDPKGDFAMREQLRGAARAAGRRFLEWTPAGPCIYNPYAHGGETEIADKVLAGERFTEPHYLRQAQRYLGHVVRTLRRAEVEVSLREIVDCLEPSRLEQLARQLSTQEARATHAYLDSLTARQKSDLAGVRDRLATLVESDIGPWLDPQTPAAECFELLGAVREHAVLYVNLEADRRPLLAQMLGAAIVQDLQTTVASLQARPSATIVVIDEFSAVAAEQVVRLFGRARSAGLSLVLGTQEISDLRLPGAEMLLERIMGNLSTVIAHRQVVPSSAQMISSLAGTRGAWKLTRHSNGGATSTRTREAVLQSELVMSLDRGCAAVIVLGGNARVRIARVLAPAQRA